MVGPLRLDAQLLQHHADLPPDALPPVVRGAVHIGRLIHGNASLIALIIQAEQVKFQLRTEGEAQAPGAGFLHSPDQKTAGVILKGASVRAADFALHLHQLPLLRPPWQQGESLRQRVQEQI